MTLSRYRPAFRNLCHYDKPFSVRFSLPCGKGAMTDQHVPKLIYAPYPLLWTTSPPPLPFSPGQDVTDVRPAVSETKHADAEAPSPPLSAHFMSSIQRKHEIQISRWTRPVTSRGEYNVNATYCAYCLSNRPYTNGVPNLQYKCMYTHHVFPAMGTQKEGRL